MAVSQETQESLDWALGTIRNQAPVYRHFRDYYVGDQTRMMDDVRLARIFGALFDDFGLNLCQPVVDSLADRLIISGFSSGEGDDDQAALETWKRNRMRRRSGHVHLDAIRSGDAYVIVWPNAAGDATIYPQRPESMAVEYDEGRPGVIVRAAKLWSDTTGRDRLTLYYPDRLERYATPPRANTGNSTPGAFDYYTDEGEPPVVVNPYGVVPVFHFANNADIGELGVSELSNAVTVQNALNKQAFDLLTNSEFQAYRQRWATGIEIQKDPETGLPINPFTAGPERVWVANAAAETEARFGEFSAADLDPMQNALHTWALFMANTTQTPVHYFQLATGLVSGESQKTAEGKLTAKVSDRQESFGDVWAQAVALAVRMDRGLASDGLELDANWQDTAPRNEKESWEIAQIKAELGVSKEQILREAGYTDEQLEQFRQEDGGPGQAPTQSPIDALLNGSNPLRIGE